MTTLARFTGRNAKRVVVAAVLLAVLAGAFGAGVASHLGPYGADDPATESVRTSNALEKATGLATTDSIVLLVRGNDRAQLERTARALGRDPAIGQVSPPTLAPGKSAAYIVGRFKRGATQKDAVNRIQRTLGSRPGVTVGGGAAANVAVNQIVQDDLSRAELLAFPLLFLLSFWFFRSLVASALPLLVGGLSIVFTFVGLRIASEGISLSVFALNLVTGLGLGLAIDYSLFMVSRYREEIAEHGAGLTALTRTVATAGRTVLFSSLTVAAALASLLIFPQKFLYSMGVGGAMVALLAAAVALVVLPAVLALLGERVNALSPARLRRAADAEARHEARGWWYRLSRFVMRRPARVAVLSSAFLIALGLPFLGVKFTSVDATVLPKDSPARVVDSALKAEFPRGRTTPVVVAAHTRSAAAAGQLAQRLRTVGGVAAVAPPRPAGPSTFRIDAFTPASDLSEASQSVVRRIRALDAPFPVGVAGRTAAFVDQKSSLAGHMPIALAWLAITTFAVLFLFTGSVILPLKALLMNALTISAAFGLLVLVFQHGRLEGLLGYTSQGALESSQPVVLFAVAFGLSTDYGVFLLSRIKEARDSGIPDREAVAVGLERTGRIVTAAALLFCVAIGAFATSRIIFIKEVGLGTAVAVLIDATVVRALLVPSLMELLGRWNWWAPRPLRRLHARFGADDGVANAARAG
ncbi:MAG: putative drug exporter of the superfamily [Thermoleophilaceae bacterium]|nr:putative drug exporter of the superfamily [Thermoleophilaceae bacterium]MEA2457713.1 putative drug exporter of the superfamily [Thermoleophilaceae bacterium]